MAPRLFQGEDDTAYSSGADEVGSEPSVTRGLSSLTWFEFDKNIENGR